jgi:hypothetical protein
MNEEETVASVNNLINQRIGMRLKMSFLYIVIEDNLLLHWV